MDDYQETRNKLWLAVQEAQKDHIKAVAAFDAIVVAGPTSTLNGLLDPAAQDRRAAFENYVQALGRFSRFLKEHRSSE